MFSLLMLMFIRGILLFIILHQLIIILHIFIHYYTTLNIKNILHTITQNKIIWRNKKTMEKIKPGFLEGVYYMWDKTLEVLESKEKKDLTPGHQIDLINGVGISITGQCENMIIEHYDQLFNVEKHMGINIIETFEETTDDKNPELIIEETPRGDVTILIRNDLVDQLKQQGKLDNTTLEESLKKHILKTISTVNQN